MDYYLHFRYIYWFYSDGDMVAEEVVDERVAVRSGTRLLLRDQEDGSFLVSEISRDMHGEFAVLTFPNKDNICIHLGETAELAYDEYYSAMGDDNHNVYVGTVTLEK